MKKRLLLKIGLPLLALGIAAAIYAYLLVTRQTAPYAPPPPKAWKVEVMTLAPGTYTPHLLLYGQLESPQTADLEAAIEADVVATPAREGRFVKQGELLILLDDRDVKLLLQQRAADVAELEALIATETLRYAADLEAVDDEQAMIDLAQRAVKRREYLEQKAVGSVQDLDDARRELRQRALQLTQRELDVNDYKNRIAQLQARLQRATALRDQAQLDVERSRIVAPFAGRVTRVYVAVGERVNDGEVLLQMFDTAAVEIRAELPTGYVPLLAAALRDGQTVTAEAKVENTLITMQLIDLAGQVDAGRAGVEALFKMTSNYPNIAIGRVLPVYLDLPAVADVYALPLTALYNADTVYKVVDNQLQAVPVTRLGTVYSKDILADTQNTRVTMAAELPSPLALIRSTALQPGDRVLVTQLPNAITGLRVTPQDVAR